jgi:hypothetical protein
MTCSMYPMSSRPFLDMPGYLPSPQTETLMVLFISLPSLSNGDHIYICVSVGINHWPALTSSSALTRSYVPVTTAPQIFHYMVAYISEINGTRYKYLLNPSSLSRFMYQVNALATYSWSLTRSIPLRVNRTM